MAAVAGEIFNTVGGLLTFLTALLGVVSLWQSQRKTRKEIREVKHSTNGRLDALLEENRRLIIENEQLKAAQDGSS